MSFPAWSIIPFILMLLGIAAFPLIPALAHHWEKPRNQLLYALALGVPVAVTLLVVGRPELVAHAVIEYVQFIALLFALFTVSGGIFLRGDLAATPRTNTIFLAIGGLLASFIGTTGAAMLLIRPLLNTNHERRYRAHTVVFTILIVANCGGLLTPLGDPPLFLGMLRGVPFTWTFSLLPQWLFVNTLLLATYWALDRTMHAKESPATISEDASTVEPLRLMGASNFLWFAMIILAVALVPSLEIDAVAHGHIEGLNWVPWREMVMLAAAAGSYLLGSKKVRFEDNQFTFGPILEVAALFVGIFLTMVPALQVLRAVAPRLPLNEVTLFVFTGGLSAVLDNAPTYATFFEMSTQIAGEPRVADVPEALLVSISLGAVLCGALTYIGNGPNFMVKSLAESDGVDMPSFLGYVREAFRYLAPVLLAMVLLFIASGIWSTIAGVFVLLALLIRCALLARAPRAASSSTESATHA
ncbi:sodium:proton antiporter [Brachybacterium timonense]|uniref:sodium:proton antiporter n=1 Tax=Brachybacterium timonense TaxID=2050896 RepID=UPI000D0B5DB7|nr:sodium:proton antiporter [Brachybacterium timonense]